MSLAFANNLFDQELQHYSTRVLIGSSVLLVAKVSVICQNNCEYVMIHIYITSLLKIILISVIIWWITRSVSRLMCSLKSTGSLSHHSLHNSSERIDYLFNECFVSSISNGRKMFTVLAVLVRFSVNDPQTPTKLCSHQLWRSPSHSIIPVISSFTSS